ncbi:MAG TPA: patatin-like phospholipase family protein [Streptosporangiales bacterium]
MTSADAGNGDGHRADLVLEGGGARGVALVGAVTAMSEAGYVFPRIAGTSAGAMLGGIAAAMQSAGEPLDGLRRVAMDVDFAGFADRGTLGRLAGPLAPLVDVGELLVENGMFRGDALHEFLVRTLADFGVHTWADLRLPDDEGTSLPESHRYALVVTVSDISRRRLVLLPWDYGRYGLDPDTQPVADAIRMSASLPVFFQPAHLRGAGTTSVMVDGGLLSDYPITVFDRTDGRPPRWPTFGVKLSGRPPATPRTHPVDGPLSYLLAVVNTVMTALDARPLDDPCVRRRTVFLDSKDVSATDFDIDRETKKEMIDDAARVTREFLAHWDFAGYLRDCRGGEQP